MGELTAGQRYEVPASAAAPALTTGTPEALQIMVGTTQAPPVGEPGRTVSGVSLKAADLLRTAQPGAPAASAPQQIGPAAPAPRRAPPPVQSTEPAVPAAGNVTAPAPGTGAATH